MLRRPLRRYPSLRPFIRIGQLSGPAFTLIDPRRRPGGASGTTSLGRSHDPTGTHET